MTHQYIPILEHLIFMESNFVPRKTFIEVDAARKLISAYIHPVTANEYPESLLNCQIGEQQLREEFSRFHFNRQENPCFSLKNSPFQFMRPLYQLSSQKTAPPQNVCVAMPGFPRNEEFSGRNPRLLCSILERFSHSLHNWGSRVVRG